MNTEPILNINGLNIYEYVVYKLKKPFHDDYLDIDVVSVHFVKIDDNIHVHFYSNPYVKNTYHPYYNECKDKIEIERIDYENTTQHEMFLNNEIHKCEEELHDFISVKSKAKLEFMKDRFMDVNYLQSLECRQFTDKVHDKVMEKLADKIADDVVDRILRQIAENKKEKEEKNSFQY